MVNRAFTSYKMPDGALEVRCHVLEVSKARILEEFLVKNLPSCYITKKQIKSRVEATGLTPSEILANKLPDPGNVMSGDFGEIFTLYYLKSETKAPVKLIKKWRYKQDRKKAAPHSDVILLHRESEEKATPQDFVICAEVKQKSTKSTFCPISDALEGFHSDKTGRLARTLTWLKEKAIDGENSGQIQFIKRFTDAEGLSVEYSKQFKAVAVIDRSLLDAEVIKKIDLPDQDESFEVLVFGIDELKKLYEKIFQRAQTELTIE